MSDPEIGTLILDVEREIKEVAKDRNDFIHALFAGDYAAAGYMGARYQTTSAKRNRTGERTGRLATYKASAIERPSFRAR